MHYHEAAALQDYLATVDQRITTRKALAAKEAVTRLCHIWEHLLGVITYGDRLLELVKPFYKDETKRALDIKPLYKALLAKIEQITQDGYDSDHPKPVKLFPSLT